MWTQRHALATASATRVPVQKLKLCDDVVDRFMNASKMYVSDPLGLGMRVRERNDGCTG